ncbi:polysaccharide deacetylase family protein [uncultured Kiloniella sp.]|uniref:polysaccharide deacetylase family protein n=1 Tax=uncultured Kiloniella sp. TaxID=1133091 RepID=UPI00261D7264|nr:polysaccharide deacetylase family protein [uncultured Kiloniella sp.]
MSAKYQGGHILLYHGVFESIPTGLESRLHNVCPDEFRRQIKWLRNQFEIVSLDDFVNAQDRRGLATITFDDAYADLFNQAIPWLIEEKLPCTVFLNSNLVGGRIFWRDKVRFILSRQLEKDFLIFFEKEEWAKQIRAERFYKDSKRPGLSSKRVDQALDVFFAAKQLDGPLNSLTKVIAGESELINDALVCYGNHSASHYVLSSLPPEQQCEEIRSCQTWLREREYFCTSSFAAPFGGANDIDESTFLFAKKAGCTAVLMSRQAVNKVVQKDTVTALPIFERYMTPPTLEELVHLSRELDQIA